MTLRMVFDRDDLQRVRIADTPDPMWELVLSLHQAREPRLAPQYVPWLEQARRRVRRTEAAGRWLTTLFTLVPPEGRFPDFLTPEPLVTDVGAGCEAMACTSRSFLRADLSAVFDGRPARRWVRDLVEGDRGQVREVVSAVRQVHDLLVAPHWHEVCATVGTDRARRVRELAIDGVGRVLAGVPGVIGWDGTVLETRYPLSRTVYLGGRGLTLVPSYFCVGNPITLIDADRPPILIYSAAGWVPRPATGEVPPQLVALLGRTRAGCLSAVDTPCTTSELAARLGTSVGTASKHATVLREAGLVSSVRHGGAVLHSLTHLGAALLTRNTRRR